MATLDLLNLYKKQFIKLLIVIKSQYLPKLKVQCGPKARLEQLIDNILQNNIPQPDGLLDANFW